MTINLLFKELYKLYPKFYFDFFKKFIKLLNNVFLYTYVLDNFNSTIDLLEFYKKNKLFLNNLDYNLDYIKNDEQNNDIIIFKTRNPIDFLDIIFISDNSYIYIIDDFDILDEINLIYTSLFYTKIPVYDDNLKNKVINLYFLKKIIIDDLILPLDGLDENTHINVRNLNAINNFKNLEYLNVVESELYSSNLFKFRKINSNKNLKYFYYVNK